MEGGVADIARPSRRAVRAWMTRRTWVDSNRKDLGEVDPRSLASPATWGFTRGRQPTNKNSLRQLRVAKPVAPLWKGQGRRGAKPSGVDARQMVYPPAPRLVAIVPSREQNRLASVELFTDHHRGP